MTQAVDVSDVVIIGDGPAGSALAQACVRAGIDTVLVGTDEVWTPTYGAWVDDLDQVDLISADDVLASRHPSITAWTNRRHRLDRVYGVIDNARLRSALRDGVMHRNERVASVRSAPDGHVLDMASGATARSRVVIDATGWPATFATKMSSVRAPAWQTAFGVVLATPPEGDLAEPTLMDFRPPPRTSMTGPASTTFAYSLPVADGWLVEETVLAARPAIEPVALIGRLASRLGVDPDDMLGHAVRTEYVRIPMGGSWPSRDQQIVAYGAAAGHVNPISGYSIVHSMDRATDVADAVKRALASRSVVDARPIWDAVWPHAARRTRVLHDYGLEMLMGLDAASTGEFFGSFFDLPTEQWSAYMRSSTSPRRVSAVMASLFRTASWSTRRRLVSGNPATFARLIRP